MVRSVLSYRIVIVIVAGVMTLAVLRFGVLPIVREIAGQRTVFTLDLGLTLSLTANFTLAVTATFLDFNRRKLRQALKDAEVSVDQGDDSANT